jgi:hypothetical protein
MYKRIDDEILVLSICPSCHDVFDVNLSLNIAEKKGN